MTELRGGEYLGFPDDVDLYNAIGNHLAFGRATVSTPDCHNFQMNFTWRIEDIFTFQKAGVEDIGHLHEAGLSRDFQVVAEYHKTFTWVKGSFAGTCN